MAISSNCCVCFFVNWHQTRRYSYLHVFNNLNGELCGRIKTKRIFIRTTHSVSVTILVFFSHRKTRSFTFEIAKCVVLPFLHFAILLSTASCKKCESDLLTLFMFFFRSRRRKTNFQLNLVVKIKILVKLIESSHKNVRCQRSTNISKKDQVSTALLDRIEDDRVKREMTKDKSALFQCSLLCMWNSIDENNSNLACTLHSISVWWSHSMSDSKLLKFSWDDRKRDWERKHLTRK